jgi:cytochrome b-561 domain-containing protein 2
MSIAFVLLMSEAILLFAVWSSPVHGYSRASKIQWHWVLQACSLLCAYTGLAVITANKVQAGKQHYTTWHGMAGITVCGSISAQAAGGIAIMWPGVLPFKVRPVVLKRIHAAFGVANYCGALLVLLLGLYSTWFVASAANSVVWNTCAISLLLLALALPIQVAYNFRK